MEGEKMGKRSWDRRLRASFVVLLAAGLLSPVHARESPQSIKVGQTVHLTLDKGETRDYLISLGKGIYWIIWDGRRMDGRASNLQGGIQLLKNNGAIVDSSLFYWNEIGITCRAGKQFRVAKTFPARLRLRNDQEETEIWLTVVPAAQLRFLPFGFGAEVSPARISTEEGVGGTLEKHGTAYHKITLPTGRWSISLGLVRPDGRNSNVMGRVDLLDPYGLTSKPQYILVNEIAPQARKEAILVVAKPRPEMFRVSNEDGSTGVNYDLSIQKATD
jgi:hypothetical protein